MKLIEEEKKDLKDQFSTARLIENRVRGRRHCEREKVQILKAYLAGHYTQEEISKKYGISVTTFCRWYSKFVAEIRAEQNVELTAETTEVTSSGPPVRPHHTPKKKLMIQKDKIQESPEVAALKAEIEQLKRDVEIARYKVHARDIMIEEIEKTLNISITKKSGAKR